MKYWEIIADKLSKAGWSLGWVSAVDSQGRTIWIVDAHRDNGKRYVVHPDEKVTAFLELEFCDSHLAANWLDGLARFLQTRRRLSGSESAEDFTPASVLRLIRTRNSRESTQRGKERKSSKLIP
jgi:hypothetical protein